MKQISQAQAINYILAKLKAIGAGDINTMKAQIAQLEADVAYLETFGHVVGANVYILPVAPASPSVGDIWYNTSFIE